MKNSFFMLWPSAWTWTDRLVKTSIAIQRAQATAFGFHTTLSTQGSFSIHHNYVPTACLLLWGQTQLSPLAFGGYHCHTPMGLIGTWPAFYNHMTHAVNMPQTDVTPLNKSCVMFVLFLFRATRIKNVPMSVFPSFSASLSNCFISINKSQLLHKRAICRYFSWKIMDDFVSGTEG